MSGRARTARAAGRISFAVFISRILGLVRDQIFAKLFGAGIYNDAWQVAFRIPNLLRDLFAEGALSSAFVPTFTEYLRRKGRSEAWLLANLVLSSLLVLLGAFALLLLLFPELFVFLLAAGFREVPGKVEITSTLLRILSPFLLFVAMASVAMGMLNALNRFFLPALAPALFNIAVILAGLFLAPAFEQRGIEPILAMAVGGLVGGVLQFLVQWPSLRKEGFRFRLRWNPRHPGIVRISRLVGPAVVGISATQINVLVNTQLASFLGNGPVSWLSYAFRIIYLPIGLFGVAVGVSNLREVSIHAADERWEELRETVANSVKLVSFLALPSSVGLIVLAVPVVRLIFERGDFTPQDTLYTGYAVAAYSLGLWAYACIKVYVPTFYALRDTRTPVRISLTAVAVNLVAAVTLVLFLPGEFKYAGLALATALSVTMNNLLLAVAFRRKVGSLASYGVAAQFRRVLAASLLMGLGVHVLYGQLLRVWPAETVVQQLLAVGTCIGSGVLGFAVLSLLFGVEETRLLVARLRRGGGSER